MNLEFEKLIPPLADSEYELLEKNILADGCREPLVVWNGFLIDGHHRLSICLEHGLPFKTVAPRDDLEDELDAKIWIARNQFGRRNLTDFQKSVLALELENLIKEKARKNSSDNNQKRKSIQIRENNECDLDRTRYKTDAEKRRDRVDGQLASIAGVSDLQIRRTRKILEKGSPEEINKLEAGEITIGEVYKDIRKKEHQETLSAHQLPEGKYRVLYVDPPWSLGSDPIASTSPDALGYYPRMTVEEIAEIPIQDICENNAVLFMWEIGRIWVVGVDHRSALFKKSCRWMMKTMS
jgi:ParB-like chromosome segregation protein Spo0J